MSGPDTLSGWPAKNICPGRWLETVSQFHVFMESSRVVSCILPSSLEETGKLLLCDHHSCMRIWVYYVCQPQPHLKMFEKQLSVITWIAASAHTHLPYVRSNSFCWPVSFVCLGFNPYNVYLNAQPFQKSCLDVTGWALAIIIIIKLTQFGLANSNERDGRNETKTTRIIDTHSRK